LSFLEKSDFFPLIPIAFCSVENNFLDKGQLPARELIGSDSFITLCNSISHIIFGCYRNNIPCLAYPLSLSVRLQGRHFSIEALIHRVTA
jgi:hypothetical protein